MTMTACSQSFVKYSAVDQFVCTEQGIGKQLSECFVTFVKLNIAAWTDGLFEMLHTMIFKKWTSLSRSSKFRRTILRNAYYANISLVKYSWLNQTLLNSETRGFHECFPIRQKITFLVREVLILVLYLRQTSIFFSLQICSRNTVIESKQNSQFFKVISALDFSVHQCWHYRQTVDCSISHWCMWNHNAVRNSYFEHIIDRTGSKRETIKIECA